ncbi:hypothetical protein [Marinobacterium aestuariivivens]|uniref:Uncharacterized protein n=1 Tax=Marinobacterium aestuariivivens TaxID=1698799 RepID=A0ABW2A4Q8_9GAMM
MNDQHKDDLPATSETSLDDLNEASDLASEPTFSTPEVPPITWFEALNSYNKKLADTELQIIRACEPLTTQLEDISHHLEALQIPSIRIPQLPELIQPAEKLQKIFSQSLGPAIEQLKQSFDELPPRTQNVLLLLGSHGWYPDLEMEMPMLWHLEEEFSTGRVDSAETLLIEYFEGRMNKIQASVATRFPHRSDLISSALDAHRKEAYELAIPVLLAQIDGICKEVAGDYLFMKDRKQPKPRTATYVSQFASDNFTYALLSPLATVLPVSASEKERGTNFTGLNRHMVLHGESLDYGTRKNGLKAISLLNYVSQVLSIDTDDHAEPR